jgi:Phytanoyl-CoA dioxygenase (PhyH)
VSTSDTIRATCARLTDQGDWRRAVEILSAEFRRTGEVVFAADALRVRHSAYARRSLSGRPQSRPAVVDDLFPETDIPEIAAPDLSAGAVASALQHHGALLVRGLIDADRAAELRVTIDGAFDGAARYREDPTAEHTRDFEPFVVDDEYEFGVYDRAFANFGGGVLGVDSPRAMLQMIEALEAAGIGEILTDYFGERPAFSVKKTTLRRTEPGSVAGWHQDGAFLGVDTRSLNIWTALSPCGVDAPGLDLFARGFDELVPLGGEDIYDWSVSDETAARYDLSRVVRPVFATGDAVLFDQMSLHRTGVDPAMSETRYAIEMWFFAPSTYPEEQIPLCF